MHLFPPNQSCTVSPLQQVCNRTPIIKFFNVYIFLWLCSPKFLFCRGEWRIGSLKSGDLEKNVKKPGLEAGFTSFYMLARYLNKMLPFFRFQPDYTDNCRLVVFWATC